MWPVVTHIKIGVLFLYLKVHLPPKYKERRWSSVSVAPCCWFCLICTISGPYEVLRKLSDTDYVVRTPARKRKSCVCHVNMLKAYHSRESSRMEVLIADNVAVRVPVPVATGCSDAACDADAEDDDVVSRHTYQQCARFKNSEVLSDQLIYHIYLNSKGVILCNWLMTFLLCLMMLLLVSQFCSMALMWVMLLQSSRMHTVYLLKHGLAKPGSLRLAVLTSPEEWWHRSILYWL